MIFFNYKFSLCLFGYSIIKLKYFFNILLLFVKYLNLFRLIFLYVCNSFNNFLFEFNKLAFELLFKKRFFSSNNFILHLHNFSTNSLGT